VEPALIITLSAVFATVALVTGAVTSVALARHTPERKRLRQMTAPRAEAPTAGKLRLIDTPSPALKRWSGALGKSIDNRSRLRRRLAAAGYDSMCAAVLFSWAQIVLPIVGAAVPLVVFGIASGWLLAAAAAFVGFSLPDLALARKIAEHKKAIQDGLPDALDLIVVCVEAGSSLDQAILKAATELEIALPVIARELKTVATETRAGKPRLQAFQDLANRTDVDDMRSLVAMLIQTDRFGTSIAQSLRTHAETSRSNRRMRAEERAGKVGVKLVFPLVLCLMPALYVVCLGPVAVKMYRVFF
jgi:tight adherence protein C